MNAYKPGDRVLSILPEGDTGMVIEEETRRTLHVLWDDGTTSRIPVNFVLPQPDLVSSVRHGEER